jgi:hypothetical protein
MCQLCVRPLQISMRCWSDSLCGTWSVQLVPSICVVLARTGRDTNAAPVMRAHSWHCCPLVCPLQQRLSDVRRIPPMMPATIDSRLTIQTPYIKNPSAPSRPPTLNNRFIRTNATTATPTPPPASPINGHGDLPCLGGTGWGGGRHLVPGGAAVCHSWPSRYTFSGLPSGSGYQPGCLRRRHDSFMQKQPSNCQFDVGSPSKPEDRPTPDLVRRPAAYFPGSTPLLFVCAELGLTYGGFISEGDHDNTHRPQHP